MRAIWLNEVSLIALLSAIRIHQLVAKDIFRIFLQAFTKFQLEALF